MKDLRHWEFIGECIRILVYLKDFKNKFREFQNLLIKPSCTIVASATRELLIICKYT